MKSLKYIPVCVPPGDFGEGVRNHCFRKQWSGLWPPIWTCCISCRVRRDRDYCCILISSSDLWLINRPCTRSFLIISTSHRCLVCKFLHVCTLSLHNLRGTEEESSVGFLIIETPKLLFILSSGRLPLTLSVICWCKESCVVLVFFLCKWAVLTCSVQNSF